MPPGLSPVHLLVILVVALVVLGPDKMPDAVRKGARFLGEAKQWSARMSKEVQNVVSMQTQDVTAPSAEHSATPGRSDESTAAQPEPTTAMLRPPTLAQRRRGCDRPTLDQPPRVPRPSVTYR